ncbi:MAG: hypothetical protein R3A10_04415 [Caldilineaceae bacterium]
MKMNRTVTRIREWPSVKFEQQVTVGLPRNFIIGPAQSIADEDVNQRPFHDEEDDRRKHDDDLVELGLLGRDGGRRLEECGRVGAPAQDKRQRHPRRSFENDFKSFIVRR